MSDRISCIVGHLVCEKTEIDRPLLRCWLAQECSAEANLLAIMHLLISHTCTSGAENATRQLQHAIDDTALGKRYPDLLGMLRTDSSLEAELVRPLLEEPVMVSYPTEEMAFDDDVVFL